MIQRGCPPLSPRRLALIAPPGSFPAAIGGIPEQVVLRPSQQLCAGDYSRWLAESIKDPELASDVAMIEKKISLDARESRARVKEAIDRGYMGAI
jgi:hypothetical protein